MAWTVEATRSGLPATAGFISAASRTRWQATRCPKQQGHGIYIGAGSGHVVTDNVAVDNSVVGAGARDGIRISATSGNTVTGNRTGSTGATALQGYGILLLSNALNNTLTGNQTAGNKYAGLVDLGSGNTLTGNR